MAADSMSIYYGPGDFDTTNSRLYGRISANAGFLKALIAHGKRTKLATYIENQKDFSVFEQQFARHLPKQKSIQQILYGDIVALQNADLFFRNDPVISKMAWARSFLNPAAFSLCGIIHSISGIGVIEEIAKYIYAPMQPWDALICTSTAGKKVIETIFQQWFEYLSKQQQQKFNMTLQLPVIPLGINTDDVSLSNQAALLRKKFRAKWRIKENDFVVLFVGRLFFYEKAHPIPMFLALQEVAQRAGNTANIHFVQAGWFENEKDAKDFKQAAKQFCPSVNYILLTSLSDELKSQVLSAADVFISLSDNIQETFGLTPLEAMANKLPVIVSDWNGYKDTVRHGVDGFRIPTIMPPAGCGVDLALGFLTEALTYATYCGLNAQKTAVDVGECAERLWQLYHSVDLRREMGEAGSKRVEEKYHWRHVIKAYDALWDEQTTMRLSAQPEAKKAIHLPPLIADPYATFGSYASIVLGPDHRLSLGKSAHHQLAVLQTSNLTRFGSQQRLSTEYLEKIIEQIKNNTQQSVQQLVDFIASIDATVSSGIVVRSLVYLIKYNFLQCDY